MTLLSILQTQKKIVKEHNIVSGDIEIELIVAHVLNCNRVDLFFKYNDSLSCTEEKQILEFCKRHISGEPLQYILGVAPFRNLTLEVGPGVLIPRPETELIVDKVIAVAPKNGNICDIATGSGVIALAIASEMPQTTVTGIDISPTALSYANRNKAQLKLNNISFLEGDLFSPLQQNERFDIITANLPYISEEEYMTLPKNVKEHEPKLALTAENNGLEIIFKTIDTAYKFLKKEGWLLLEMGETQGDAVKNYAISTSHYQHAEIVQDLTQRDRFVFIKY